MPRLRDKLRRGFKRDLGLIVVGLILAGLVVLTGRLASDNASNTAVDTVVREAYRQDIENWHGRVAGCIRGKRDRTATALALRAQAVYLDLVLDAESVQEDVKRAARVNQRIQDLSAADLESRTGDRLDCEQVYPKPPTPDGVETLP